MSEVFHNRTVALDGQSFVGCRFINADLRYGGSLPFSLSGNSFEGYLNLEFDRRGPHCEAMAIELEQAFRDVGLALDMPARIARCAGPVWRFHTLLPRDNEPPSSTERR